MNLQYRRGCLKFYLGTSTALPSASWIPSSRRFLPMCTCGARKSSWNSHATTRKALTTLRKALGDLVKDRYIILLLDVAGVHIHPTIHSLARRLRIRLLFLPAKLTYLLQPCDTHLFRRFKHSLQESFREIRSRSDSGSVTAEQWLHLIFKTIRGVIQGVSWKHAFGSVGILEEQRQLAPWVVRQMGLSSLPAVGHEPPSSDEASVIFPKHRRLNAMAHVLWPEPPGTPAFAAGSASSSGSAVL